jgi:virginiamycin B lyase
MPMPSRTKLVLAALTVLGTSGVTHAAMLTGTVSSGGRPVTGALVTLADDERLVSETVLTDATGRYQLATKLTGSLRLRARAQLSADQSVSVQINKGDEKLRNSFNLKRLKGAQAISDSLPASAHFARIQFKDPELRKQFQLDCLSCHPIGNPYTRIPREKATWNAILQKMVRYCGYSSDVRVADYASAMYRAFDGSTIEAGKPAVIDPEVLSARITEWKLKGAQIAHDTEFNPADGRFYTTDMAIDQIYVTDPKTHTTTTVPLPDAGVPVGGSFSEKGYPTPFGLTSRHGLHSMQVGPNGLIYTTGSIGGELGVFDPVAHTYKVYRLGPTVLYPHTLRFAEDGMLWFTVFISNQVGRFDPATEEITLIELPNHMARKDERQPGAYGLDVNPLDGSIWYSKLWANMIGRIDPKTLEVKEFEPPVFGPRRIRFDRSGNLWIPGFGDGTLAKLDTRTMAYTVHEIPPLAPGEVEAPYAVGVDPRTQDVWITANQSDRMFRFMPASGRFIAYPLPSRGTYMRDVIFPGDGRVCSSSNPMPPLEVVVEGGMDALVCIDPDGNK